MVGKTPQKVEAIPPNSFHEIKYTGAISRANSKTNLEQRKKQ